MSSHVDGKNLEKEGSTTHGSAGDKELFGIHVSAAFGKHFSFTFMGNKGSIRLERNSELQNQIHEVGRSFKCLWISLVSTSEENPESLGSKPRT
jgi:hypothetical protein